MCTSTTATAATTSATSNTGTYLYWWHKILQICSKDCKQHQNYVQHWIQKANTIVSQTKLYAGYVDQCAYDMRAHISDLINFCSRKSLKLHTPLKELSGSTPDQFLNKISCFYVVSWIVLQSWRDEDVQEAVFGYCMECWNYLCSKTLDVHDNLKNNCQIQHRSIILQYNPYKAFETQMFFILRMSTL